MFKTLLALIEHTLALLLGKSNRSGQLSAGGPVQFFQLEQDYFAANQADQAVALFTETYGKAPRYIDSVHPWTLLKGRSSTGMPLELPLNEVLRQSPYADRKALPQAVHLSLTVDM
ncbi:MAG: hypothetical protein K2X80_03865 [Pseudomonadaceae bacterium]|jgi:hypothetical protein|nr:hypothetical protein [Pseudomonadaceae bacterium]